LGGTGENTINSAAFLKTINLSPGSGNISTLLGKIIANGIVNLENGTVDIPASLSGARTV
jgi:hypothetical protein